jgi:RAB protein geranylgeranyltransferase component A
VYRQLEFQAVGNWWMYDGGGTIKRLPNGREDIFQDKAIDNRAKRSVMKFLKFVIDYENQTEIWEPYAGSGLAEFLSSQFQLPPNLQGVITALTLSLDSPEVTTVRWALPRIARHLTSIGVFGPGFGAVIPKWGGGAEIAQVACRAGAVGGGVYILGTGVQDNQAVTDEESQRVAVTLSNGETVKTKHLVGAADTKSASNARAVSKIIAVVASPLASLFTSTVEGSPLAAVSVVVVPSKSLSANGITQPHPVYIMVHSSETGECAARQCQYNTSTSFPL